MNLEANYRKETLSCSSRSEAFSGSMALGALIKFNLMNPRGGQHYLGHTKPRGSCKTKSSRCFQSPALDRTSRHTAIIHKAAMKIAIELSSSRFMAQLRKPRPCIRTFTAHLAPSEATEGMQGSPNEEMEHAANCVFTEASSSQFGASGGRRMSASRLPNIQLKC